MNNLINLPLCGSFSTNPRSYLTQNGAFFFFDGEGIFDKKECGVAIFNIKSETLIMKIPFSFGKYSGRLMYASCPDFDAENECYCFYHGDKFFTDKRAEKYINVPEYGRFSSKEYLLSSFEPEFVWEDDDHLSVPFENTFIYQLHARGFTKSRTSGCSCKGTFKAIPEKISYLKGLGCTTLEFQPVNEFNENDIKTGKLNYWGYCEGLYYAPKSGYSASDDAGSEFSMLVNCLHKNGMDIILQFYFPPAITAAEIISVLEFWVIRYHIDGFHLMGENIPLRHISESVILADTKIISDRSSEIFDISSHIYPLNRRFASCNDEYLFSLRRFLKGDEYSMGDALSHMRFNPAEYGVINYFDNFNSLTILDMVSYNGKHNEENGEDNSDGNDYNCSWNCGEEGPSRKQKVLALRDRQLLNALNLLFFSCGTPMIYMGDEMGRTQKGNNNPYCHDNELNWLNWNGLKGRYNFYDTIKNLAACRLDNTFLHKSGPLSVVDIYGCGFPELSYHGESAWKSQIDSYRHSIGILYCDHNNLLYMGINMHWVEEKLALPRPPKGFRWERLYNTSDGKISNLQENAKPLIQGSDNTTKSEPVKADELEVRIPERSISYFRCVRYK